MLEALSIGARCLVSDIPENTVVTDIYGATFKPEDTDDLARALERECTQEYPDAMRQQQIQYIHTNFEYDVMLDRYEEVYHHVVGDPLKAMPSTLKKEECRQAQKHKQRTPRKRLTAFPGRFRLDQRGDELEHYAHQMQQLLPCQMLWRVGSTVRHCASVS